MVLDKMLELDREAGTTLVTVGHDDQITSNAGRRREVRDFRLRTRAVGCLEPRRAPERAQRLAQSYPSLELLEAVAHQRIDA